MLDSTDFCSAGWYEFIAGLRGATGSIESTERYTGSSSITLANTAGGTTISGSVLWNEETFENNVAERRTYSQSFTFTGAVTVT